MGGDSSAGGSSAAASSNNDNASTLKILFPGGAGTSPESQLAFLTEQVASLQANINNSEDIPAVEIASLSTQVA